MPRGIVKHYDTAMDYEYLIYEINFLIDRLNELEFHDDDFAARDFFGHVEPPIARLTHYLEEHGHRN